MIEVDQDYLVSLDQGGLDHLNYQEVLSEQQVLVEESQSLHLQLDKWRRVLGLPLLLSQPMSSTDQHGISITDAQQFPLSMNRELGATPVVA